MIYFGTSKSKQSRSLNKTSVWDLVYFIWPMYTASSVVLWKGWELGYVKRCYICGLSKYYELQTWLIKLVRSKLNVLLEFEFFF